MESAGGRAEGGRVRDRRAVPRPHHQPQGGHQEEQGHDGGAAGRPHEEVQHGAAQTHQTHGRCRDQSVLWPPKQ